VPRKTQRVDDISRKSSEPTSRSTPVTKKQESNIGAKKLPASREKSAKYQTEGTRKKTEPRHQAPRTASNEFAGRGKSERERVTE